MTNYLSRTARRYRTRRSLSRRLQLESCEPRIVLAAQPVISEVMAQNQRTLIDGNGNSSDWIEIQNLGDAAANLAGHFLTDNVSALNRWPFPAVEVPAGGKLVVFASGDGVPDAAGQLHTNFRLSAGGERVALVAPDGVTVVDRLDFPALPADVSYGRSQTSSLTSMITVGAAAKFLVPTSLDAGQVGASWRGGDPSFSAANWQDVSLGIGFGDGAGGGESINIARNATVTASGPLWPGFTASRLTDGDRTTISHPATPVPSFEYLIDLGVESALEAVDVYNRADGCCPERLTNYRVTVHDDDEGEPGAPVWTADVRVDRTNSGAGGVDRVTAELDPFGDFAGRYIKIAKIDDGRQDYWPQIGEVEIFPALGYAELIQTNVQTAMSGVNASSWVRASFDVADPANWTELILQLQYDDGLVAYLNGHEIVRRNAAAGEPAFDAQATAAHAGRTVESFTVSPEWLVAGTNALAIQAMNVAADDPDYLLVPQLTGRDVDSGPVGFLLQPTPGDFNPTSVAGFLPHVEMDVPRGYYDTAFNLRLAATAGATLVYTTDGSTPSLTHGIEVVPASDTDVAFATLPVSTTTMVRAASYQTNFAPSPVVTQSYLFLNDVIHQPARPDDMPSTWAGESADYQMDPDVVDDPVYRDRIIGALRSIPTLSIVTNHDHLWDAASGIYINSTQRGDSWERPVSLEWIQPDGSTGFQVDAGLRMWGTGWAPHSSSKKHSFQLKFKPEYGPSKLSFPMFPDAPVDEFDDIVLRAQGSRSWSDFRQPDITQSQYLRDAWARDTARDMGKLEGHATFVHLYLNGLYWGLYNPVERTNEAFAEEYLGGDSEDYDVVNKRSGQATHATSGDMQAWNAMMAIADAGLESPAAYAAIQQYLDVDDFIDYMLIQQYATNHDGPDQGGNNMRALRRRDESGRFTFHVWDMEYTMWYEDEHRNIDGDVADSPMRLFSRLRENSDFRQRFGDHVQRHFFNGGALTPERAAARWQARATEIDQAIIGESARWGDARRAKPYTRDIEWVAERDRLLNEYFPNRTRILLGHLTDAGLFPRVPAPEVNAAGTVVPVGFPLNLTATDGTVYFTLDGSDPRLEGGQISQQAQAIVPQTTLVSPGASTLAWVPTHASQDSTWMDPLGPSNLPEWTSAVTPLGYDVAPIVAATPVALANATATFSQATRSVANTIDGDPSGRGWGFSQPVDFQGPVIRSPIAVWETIDDIGYSEGTELAFTLRHDTVLRGNLGRFRLSITTDSRDQFADGLERSGDVTANWVPLVPFEMSSSEGAAFELLTDGSIRVSGGANRRDSYTIRALTSLQNITGVRLETLKDASLPGRAGPGRAADGNAVLSEFSLTAAPASLSSLFAAPSADLLASAMYGKQTSLYVRIPFTISADQQASFDRLKLRLQYPDGFVAYLNGQEIARQAPAGPLDFDAAAAGPRARSESLEYAEWTIPDGVSLLRAGDNLLALHVLNAAPDQSSLLISPMLIAEADLGLIIDDETHVQARTLRDGEWSSLTVAQLQAVGDLTNDGQVDEHDIDRLCLAINTDDPTYDLTGDGRVDDDDLRTLVNTVLGTSFGDANLDGRFNSSDLVRVFQVGEYEDPLADNSTWSEGDWNCDGEFSTADLVVAFQQGGYTLEATARQSTKSESAETAQPARRGGEFAVRDRVFADLGAYGAALSARPLQSTNRASRDRSAS